ncbi:MAG: hypothetical protein B6D47_02015 [Rhodocyclaceae bacterium UTPRO2]|nr:MAG: hypothetical protein B6D47_02015 [Rhodocyclaceae bacterium UTPRO2]
MSAPVVTGQFRAALPEATLSPMRNCVLSPVRLMRPIRPGGSIAAASGEIARRNVVQKMKKICNLFPDMAMPSVLQMPDLLQRRTGISDDF